MTSYFSVTDLFCGAGGSSLGAHQASQDDRGVQVRIAVNHWRKAVDTHAANFKNTDHDCADISQVHPSRYPRTSILIASPECTNYTRAKGKKRKDLHEADLWGTPQLSVEEERSRVRMFDPVYFAEHHKYDFVIIENVVDVRLWTLYGAWLKAWQDLGYEYKELFWNSMFFHPTPQSRDRLYVVLWKRGMPAPDLDWRPRAWCPKCSQDVESVQSWKDPLKKHGKWGARNQYVYRCPRCAEECTPYYYCAWNCIDPTIPTVRIGDRPAHGLKPLVPRTLERIQVGLQKFGRSPQVVDFVHSGGASWMVRDVSSPMPTQLANRTLGLTVPPFLISQSRTHGHNRRAYSAEAPAPTQTGKDKHSLIVPPFLLSYYGGRDALAELEQALPTVPTANRHALIEPTEEIRVEDCGFRMFQVSEIKRAMAFPDDYRLLGNQDDQVKMLGNAVTPPPMEQMIRACLDVYGRMGRS